MKRWKGCVSILLMCMAVLLTGCWNNRELNDLAVVVGIGIDKLPDTKEFRVSFQIINPKSVSLSGKGGGGTASPIIVYSANDQTIFGALRKASQNSTRQLFFAHNQLLVIGEAVARGGISEIFDFFERAHELRLNVPILIARDSDAESVLKIITPFESSSAQAITSGLETTSKIWSHIVDTQIIDMVRTLVGRGEPTISGVRIVSVANSRGNKNNTDRTKLPVMIEIKGIALFHDAKLVRWLDGKAARGTLWAQNKIKGTTMNVDCGREKEGTAAIELVRSKTNVRVDMNNGLPVFHLRINEEGNVNEIHCPIDLSKSKEILSLQTRWEELTKQEVLKAINVAKTNKSDIFSFGEAVKRDYPDDWRILKKTWPAIFAKCEIKVEVEAILRRTGLREKPYFLEK